MDKHKTPNARLKAFFDSTTLSVREFATEIGKPNGYQNTCINVFNGKRDPSSKLVKTIIRRYPQLSFDWIFVGTGEMLNESQLDYMLSVVDKEEKEDEMPATRVDVEMLWDRVDQLEKRLSALERRLSNIIRGV